MQVVIIDLMNEVLTVHRMAVIGILARSSNSNFFKEIHCDFRSSTFKITVK